MASLRNTWRSGQNLILVPVFVFGTLATCRRPDFRVKSAAGPSPANSPATPRRKLVVQVWPSRSTSMSRRADRAFTTDAPTPCRPPEAVYEPPPNLPPACSLVMTSSTPESLVFRSLSTGMPRPLSRTSADPSACKITSTRVQ